MIRAASAHVVRMPMAQPVAHARATRSLAENVVVTVDVDGFAGVGESVPRDYVTGETVATVLEAYSRMDLGALGREIEASTFEETVRRIERLDLPHRLRKQDGPGLAAACSLEMALLDATGRRFDEPLRRLARVLALPDDLCQGEGRRYPLSTLVDFSADLRSTVNPATVHHVKVKVGRNREWDVQRVADVRNLVGGATSLSVDVNMAWSLDEARRMANALEPYDVRWYEEPLAKGALEDYRRLREDAGVKVMLDESLCSYEDARSALAAGACDLFNIRISKCGGLVPSLRLAELAHHNGLGYQVGCQIGEFAILEAAARALVGAVRGWVSYGGAGSHQSFSAQVVRERLPIVDEATGTIGDLAGPGLGVTAAMEVITRFAGEAIEWRGRSWERVAADPR